MSDHNSNGAHEEDSHVQDARSEDAARDHKEEKTLKPEVQAPAQASFGRPRKHPYKPGKYKCEYCDVMCSKPSVLKKHVRAHTNERPYPCSICRRSFKTKSNLSKHMKSKSHFSKTSCSKLPSIKEKAAMMLQALSGVDPEPSSVGAEIANNIEYDCAEKSATTDNSPNTSCDDRSVASEDNSTEESMNRGGAMDHCLSRHDDAPDNELPSFSGMLTINAQSGPFTVEVEIKPETMKQLQHGLSTMTMKKFRASSPGSSMMSRNDADVRAAESILHMANQRLSDVCLAAAEDRASPVNVEHKLMAPKEENRRSENTESPDPAPTPRVPDYAHYQSKPVKVSPLSYSSKSMSRGRMSSKTVPNEDQRKLKKCLMESLLKKMQKKSQKSPIQGDISTTGSISRGYKSYSVTESAADSSQISPGSSVHSAISQKRAAPGTSPYKLNTLISESLSPNLIGLSGSPGKQAVILQRSSPSRSLTPVSLASNSAFLLLPSFTDQIQRPQPIRSPISAEVLSKALTNTQTLFQHRDSNGTTPAPIPMTPSIDSTSVFTPIFHSIKEESTIQDADESGSPGNTVSTEDSEAPSYHRQTSNQTTQESDSCSSPRLCIVEDVAAAVAASVRPSLPPAAYGHLCSAQEEDEPDARRSAESDEEIDVVNTDSDDNDAGGGGLTVTHLCPRLAGRGEAATVTKKRRGQREFDGSPSETEPKRPREAEKPVALHAPNINAKDLVQDCPLNLSANRQPNIPASSQALENIYGPMVVTSTTPPDTSLAALTNNNPAHPTSLRDAPPPLDTSGGAGSNGHHLDYPIFEDKVRCEVCAQLIEPSKLSLHKSMHIFTEGKDAQAPGGTQAKHGQDAPVPKQAFNKPRTYRCVVCNIGFRVAGHLSKHHKSKTHLGGLVSSGLLSKALNAKIEENKVPIGEVIDQKTGNIIPDVLSKYLSDWSHAAADSDSG